jgi:hypothetical protein
MYIWICKLCAYLYFIKVVKIFFWNYLLIYYLFVYLLLKWNVNYWKFDIFFLCKSKKILQLNILPILYLKCSLEINFFNFHMNGILTATFCLFTEIITTFPLFNGKNPLIFNGNIPLITENFRQLPMTKPPVI